MAKRKKSKRTRPNLPQETLERARAQAGEEVEEEAIEQPETEDVKVAEEAKQKAQRREARARRRKASGITRQQQDSPQFSKDKRRRKTEEMDQSEIAYLLAHPTKEVSEEQLHEEYGYVLADLRNMGLLAAALFVGLILLAQVFV